MVADAMQQGEEVAPKLFADASVFFCDVVMFQQLAMESEPMDIVKLLNDIYTRFDDVIARFRVYKVGRFRCSVLFSVTSLASTLPLSSAQGVKVKVKFSHTRYRALGPELIPVYRQSARR